MRHPFRTTCFSAVQMNLIQEKVTVFLTGERRTTNDREMVNLNRPFLSPLVFRKMPISFILALHKPAISSTRNHENLPMQYTEIFFFFFFSEEKVENFIGFFKIFLIFNISCRGGSNEYPQCMFWIKNKKIRYTPANPSFTI